MSINRILIEKICMYSYNAVAHSFIDSQEIIYPHAITEWEPGYTMGKGKLSKVCE